MSLRVAIIADYREEKWPSMDLVAEMLTLHLNRIEGVEAKLIRPPMPRIFSRLLGARGHNLDRLFARFVHYPAYVSRLHGRFDIFHIADHSYSQLAHQLPAERTIVTCHDIDTFRAVLGLEDKPWWFRQMVSRIAGGMRRAAHVVCVSNQTFDDVRRYKLAAAERLGVVRNGVSEEYFAAPSPAAVAWVENWLRENGLADKTLLLHVGSTIARKRIDILLRVLAAVAEDRKDVALIRVGGVFTPEQEELARSLGVADRIYRLAFLEREILVAFYHRTTLVLQTSAYEGFGLPVAEAMACGATLVASNIPVIKEVGGPLGHYCALENIAEWKEQVLSNLIDKGNEKAIREWAKRYDWANSCQILVQQYYDKMRVLN